ncbi:MFS transporter [Paenibacillus sp. CAA11]|uniref:MFS transporter n=1 Tax=Paenibacillus sp. CAA11 TaxID=1532905 RepID=UPI001F23752C|nr:MFS transporter [Paenibacillus sp. CAA11]
MARKAVLNHQSILLLIVNGLFVLAGALSGTFLNVYLWRTRPDFAMIGWFTFSQQLALGLTFWLAGKWVKEKDKMIFLRLGILVSGVFYLLVLWAGPATVHLIWPLGLLFGIGSGLFWLAFNVVYFEVTDVGTRDLFNGWVGILGSVIGLFGPWASGWILSSMKDVHGYRVIFIASLVIYTLGVLLSLKLKKRKREGSYDWKLPLTLFRRGNPWRQAGTASMAHGIREGVFSFLLNLLVFISTSKEWRLGQFSFAVSFVSLITFWLAGKFFKQKYRYYGMLIGAICLLLTGIPLLWKVNYGTLLTLGIGSAFFMPLYLLPMISSVFDLIGKSDEDVENRVELVVVRELSMMVGRLLGTLLFILCLGFRPQMQALTWLMFLVGASPLLSWLFLRKLLRKFKSPAMPQRTS